MLEAKTIIINKKKERNKNVNGTKHRKDAQDEVTQDG